MNIISIDKEDKITILPDPVYELAKEFFLKRAPTEFINDKSEAGYKAQADNAIKVAEFFIEFYENNHSRK